ncbi:MULTISPECIES: ABC-three component system middle component 5 [Burkholderia]|uniref:ABC-three component system middle component 5 n=1 Tax=Burkholderia TaxID=32008 RepID=UPI001583C084|nr:MULTISPECIES: ABC-three component system middle component 5 [Burkholderia]
MLIYHPAFDAYHCVFRMLLLAERVENIEIEKARLLDFYLVFPGMVREVRLPDTLKTLRAHAKAAVNVYRDPVSGLSTFRDMRHIQEAALKSIAASGLIDIKRYEHGFVTRTDVSVAPSLKEKLDEFVAVSGPVIEGILTGLSQIPLRGPNGLKHRSELMEHRYDFV